MRHRGQNAPKYTNGQTGYPGSQTGNSGYPAGQPGNLGYPGNFAPPNAGYPNSNQGVQFGYPGSQSVNSGSGPALNSGASLQKTLTTSTTTTPKPEVPTNYRQEEKKILDRILDKEVYDRRMRPSGVNSSGEISWVERERTTVGQTKPKEMLKGLSTYPYLTFNQLHRPSSFPNISEASIQFLQHPKKKEKIRDFVCLVSKYYDRKTLVEF
jgi:hypothetical protein